MPKAVGIRITKMLHVQGGDACVEGTRIPVWMLERRRRLGMADDAVLATAPGLTRAELEAAWDYVADNRAEIDIAIEENEQGEEGFAE